MPKIIATFCNQTTVSENNTNTAPCYLAEIDLSSGIYTKIHLDLARWNNIKILGVTGIASFEDGYILATQSSPPMLIKLNRFYSVTDVWLLNLVKDPHSVALKNEVIYVASTGTDSIIAFNLVTQKESVYAVVTDSGKDSVHINSLLFVKNELHATAFGKKEGALWQSAQQGYLINIQSGEFLLNQLSHPHSCIITNFGLVLCESARSRVLFLKGGYLKVFNSYIRGLAYDGHRLFVGLSHGRKISRSTDKVVGNMADPGQDIGVCGVAVYSLNSEKVSESRLERFFDLDELGKEIYDLMLV
ncbi:DUF4915 domain-containing protein [Sphaerothrix gracilis]|uniref:DUF4915 domain-containing protein n=1 Tax=Sphaerothrix gracilis TaxID=3151835 RepID=UPI0031FBB8F7